MNWYHIFFKQTTEDYVKDVINNPPKKNPLNAISYNKKFMETDEDTIRCTYNTRLTCDGVNFDRNIAEFMKLEEIQMNKTIHFHNSACKTKVIVDNINATNGEAFVNLSYLQ